jgi:hypothetical protein
MFGRLARPLEETVMRKAGTSIAGVAALMLTGCASMSGDECAMGDWHAIGFEDGSRGYAADRVGDHRKACAKHGIAPNFVAWRAGHEEGLRLYCQPSRGFTLGSNGGSYNGACASDLEPAFLDAYRTGAHLHTLRSNVDSASSAIHARERELEETQERMRDTEAQLLDSETEAADRILLLADLKELAEKSGEIESEIDALIDERARHEERLASYQAVLADSGY